MLVNFENFEELDRLYGIGVRVYVETKGGNIVRLTNWLDINSLYQKGENLMYAKDNWYPQKPWVAEKWHIENVCAGKEFRLIETISACEQRIEIFDTITEAIEYAEKNLT